jgi:hypothetical protein
MLQKQILMLKQLSLTLTNSHRQFLKNNKQQRQLPGMIFLQSAFIILSQILIQIKQQCFWQHIFILGTCSVSKTSSLPLSVINCHSHCVGHRKAVPLALAVGTNQWETPNVPV